VSGTPDSPDTEVPLGAEEASTLTVMPDDADEWLEPEDQMGLWEHQGEQLTVRSLLVGLVAHELGEEVPSELTRQLLSTTSRWADLPVEVEFYDGVTSRTLRPMHIDLRAASGRPSAVVITVT
jgi:hypothetical protein